MGNRATVLQPPKRATLAEWFGTPKGAYVLAWEHAQYDSAVEDVFGFNALQVGLPEIDFLRANRMPYRFRAGRSDCRRKTPGLTLQLPDIQFNPGDREAARRLDLLPGSLGPQFCLSRNGSRPTSDGSALAI